MEKRKTSFLGSLIIVIIIIVTIYILTKQASVNYIMNIKNIDDKYMINSAKLLPFNEQQYITELKAINNNQHTQPIIDFVNLDLKGKKIQKQLKINQITNQNCVSKELSLNIDAFIFTKNKILQEFEEEKDNTKLNKIFWNDYITILNNTNEFEKLKIELNKVKKC